MSLCVPLFVSVFLCVCVSIIVSYQVDHCVCLLLGLILLLTVTDYCQHLPLVMPVRPLLLLLLQLLLQLLLLILLVLLLLCEPPICDQTPLVQYTWPL